MEQEVWSWKSVELTQEEIDSDPVYYADKKAGDLIEKAVCEIITIEENGAE